eukprot:TRINITY_DN6612_c0_g1_i2.p1 TRINITY_DN6612_c0_g1~~TRINITY_DN6612_c0_g1_i2.p1  ORF type:complete len:230 (+),score=16.16 TRINITY_DN6612_c0_g1_i2:173-862(+)
MMVTNKKRGASEITIMFLVSLLAISLIMLGIFVKSIKYNMYIGNMFADIRGRMLRRATIFQVNDINDLELMLTEIKEEYFEDFLIDYENDRNLPIKIMEEILETIEIEEVNDGEDNIKDGILMYKLILNREKNYSVQIVMFSYKPKFVIYLLIPEFNKYQKERWCKADIRFSLSMREMNSCQVNDQQKKQRDIQYNSNILHVRYFCFSNWIYVSRLKMVSGYILSLIHI